MASPSSPIAEPTAATRRPRGRPQRLPDDDTPATSPCVDGTKRVAWLLATRRGASAADGGAARSRQEFAERLRQRGVRADSSRISRWESGVESIPARLVRAYEVATGAPPYLLVGAQRLLARQGHVVGDPGRVDEHVDDHHEWFDEVVERLQSHAMTGELWLLFADSLSRFDRVYLPPRLWRTATDLLVSETARAIGPAQLRRREAAALLMRNPIVRPHLTRSVGAYALDPGAQLTTSALILLGDVPQGAATQVLSRMVTAGKEPLASGAALTLSTSWWEGEPVNDEKALEHYVARRLTEASSDPAPGGPPLALLGLATRLSDEAFARVITAAGAGHRRRLMTVRDSHELVDATEARVLSDHVAHHAETLVGRHAQDPDLMLRRLLREALFHAHRDRRHLASTLILVSPYARAVGEVALQLTGHADARTAALSWALARRLGSALDPRHLHTRVLEETRPSLMSAAFACLAMSGAGMTDQVASHIARSMRMTDAPTSVAHSGLLAFGMDRRRDLLHVIDDPALEPLAQWWLNGGGAVRDTI